MCAWLLLMCAGRFRLDFYPWCNFNFARHMFMHTYPFFSFYLFYWWCVSLSLSLSLSVLLSLSLSRIDCAWHLNLNPLRLGTLLVPGLLLLILSFPLFTFGSMMGRPNRTSLRTFRNMAFIQSAMLFCRTFPTLLSLRSFRLRAGNLFMRYPWGVLSCLYRSFTPTYTASIPLYLVLPRHFEVHVS